MIAKLIAGTVIAMFIFMYGWLETGVALKTATGIYSGWSALSLGILIGTWCPFFLKKIKMEGGRL